MAKNVTFRVSYDMTEFALMQQSGAVVEPSDATANRWFIQEDDEEEREVTHEEFVSSLRELHPEWFPPFMP